MMKIIKLNTLEDMALAARDGAIFEDAPASYLGWVWVYVPGLGAGTFAPDNLGGVAEFFGSRVYDSVTKALA